MKRREFLEVLTVSAGVAVTAGRASAADETPDAPAATDQAVVEKFETPPTTSRGDMRYRKLGNTGVEVSVIGVGGYHIGTQKDEAESVRIIRSAIDAGVNFLDNSWDYNNGASEERMGKALRDGYRDKVFLMTKIDGRTKESAAKQLDESLKRLQTDRLDLLQLHEVIRLEDPDRILAPGGALEAVQAAQKAGKTRYLGFTGHKDPLVHLRMLHLAAEHGFRFDTVQMPINVMDAHFRSFAARVLPVLLKENIGVLGMKCMGSGLILRSKAVTPVECLHYSLTLPVSVQICGIDSMDVLKQDLGVVKNFKPLSHEEMTALLGRAAQAAAHGKYERFKTTADFDATASHPQWLG